MSKRARPSAVRSARIELLEERRLLATSSGAIDPTFGNNGRTTVAFSNVRVDNFFASAVQSDGKILVAGSTNATNGTDIALARLNPDATLDTSFGITPGNPPGGGVFSIPLDTNTDTLLGVVVQPDGRIVVVGSIGIVDPQTSITLGQAIVIRLMPNGTPDASFGTSGLVFLPLSTNSFGAPNSEARGVALQSDGKIVIAGTADIDTTTNTSGFAAARLNTDGSLDTSFGDQGTGIRVLTEQGLQSSLLGVAVDSFDRILLTGTLIAPAATTGSIPVGIFLTARLNADGTDDNAFGNEGIATATFTPRGPEVILPFGTRLAVQPDGRIVTAGIVLRANVKTNAISTGVAVVRYTDKGQPDSTFGQNGQTETFLGPPTANEAYALPTDLSIDANGKILVVNRASLASDSNNFNSIAVIRLNSNGRLDKTFNKTGKLLITPTGFLTPRSVQPKASVNVPTFTDAARTAAATAAVSPGVGVFVLNGANNTVQATLLKGDGADLVVLVQPFRSATALTGSNLSFTLKLANQGNAQLRSNILLDFKLAQTAAPSDSDRSLGQLSVPVSLGNGILRVVPLTLTIPPDASLAGTYFLRVQANPNRAAPEANFLNNTSFSPTQLTVSEGFVQLDPTIPSNPAQIRIGKSSVVTLRFTNTGNLPATGSFTLELLASKDGNESTDDIELLAPLTRKVSARAVNGVLSLRLPVVATAGAIAGNYLLLIKMDASAVPGARNPIRLFNLNRPILLV